MKSLVIFFASILLCGCAVNSGVISVGKGTFMVSRHAATSFSGSSTLKAEAIQEANKFCTARNKAAQVLGATEAQPPFVVGNYPKAEIQFTLV